MTPAFRYSRSRDAWVLRLVGRKVGPDITGANRQSIDYLLENIFDPSAVIPKEYAATTLNLKNGRVVTGIVREETGAALTVPTDAYRAGDFRGALTGRQLGTDPLGRPIFENTIYDPRSTSTAPNGSIVSRT